MRFRHPCKHRGFTLIELMIVVTILAVLAALLIPALGKAQTRAIERDCVSKLKAIPQGIRLYSMKYNGWTNPNDEEFIRIHFNAVTDSANLPPPEGVDDFRCQAEAEPKQSSDPAGYAISYLPVGPYVGGNLMTITNPSGTLAAHEINDNHERTDPDTGDKKLGGFICYADGHIVNEVESIGGPSAPGPKLVSTIVVRRKDQHPVSQYNWVIYEVQAFDEEGTNVLKGTTAETLVRYTNDKPNDSTDENDGTYFVTLGPPEYGEITWAQVVAAIPIKRNGKLSDENPDMYRSHVYYRLSEPAKVVRLRIKAFKTYLFGAYFYLLDEDGETITEVDAGNSSDDITIDVPDY